MGPIVLAGPIFHPLDDAREVLRFYREFIAAAPDELTTIFDLRVAPPLPFLPEDVHGKPIVMVGRLLRRIAGGRASRSSAR